MSWNVYKLTYQILSPLHIGYRKIGNIQSTRYYVPGRTLWGAITARLTREIFTRPQPTDYQKIGNYVKKHLIMSYFFLKDHQLYTPKYIDGQMKYGNLMSVQFESRFISSRSTTAIFFGNLSAEEATLHEIELIVSQAMNDSADRSVFLEGYLYVDQDRSAAPPEISLLKESQIIDWLDNIRIGADLGYGNGRVKLMDKHLFKSIDQLEPVDFNSDKTMCAHLIFNDIFESEIEGPIEPFVGREWANDLANDRFGPGQNVTNNEICWLPGSKIISNSTNYKLTLKPFGLWEITHAS